MKRYINEAPESVNVSKYKNIDFKDRIVGSSTPTKDKINPSLLADVDKAAGIAGTKGSVTTAVTGHKKGTRHESGLAVDLAMFDGKGYHSIEDAKKKGIYDKIEKFVKALESMGYKVNSESGNDKAVLWFGFPNHNHHVHVSRKSDSGGSTPSSTTSTSTPTTTTTTSGDTGSSSGSTDSDKGTLTKLLPWEDLAFGAGFSEFAKSVFSKNKEKDGKEDQEKKSDDEKLNTTDNLTEELDRIKDLIKKVL